MLNYLLFLSMVHEYAYFVMNIFGKRSIEVMLLCQIIRFILDTTNKGVHTPTVCTDSFLVTLKISFRPTSSGFMVERILSGRFSPLTAPFPFRRLLAPLTLHSHALV